MEKDRSSKVIAIAALLVAVVALSVGFAAVSRTLNISSSANVAPENNMKVLFSISGTQQLGGSVTGEVTAGYVQDADTNPSAEIATIASDASTTISGLKANFTKPGQEVTYEFYAHNDGAFDAYLTNITFENVTGTSNNKKCNPSAGTTESYAQDACADINIEVTVGENTGSGDDITVAASGSMPNISNHMLAKGSYEKVTVVISYPTGSNVSDGDFGVVFGDLTLTYSSVDSE